jgi:DNA-binding transcriptional LysR family regulator
LALCKRERARLVIAKLDRLSRNVAFPAALMDRGVDFVACDNPHAGAGGETLFEDSFGWFAAPAFQHKAGEKLRLAMLAAPCGVRAQAIRELDEANIGWVEAFTGGGVAAIAAAIASGLAVAPLARRVAPPGTVDIGAALSLPRLGNSAVVLHSRVSDGRALGALRTLAATFRGVASKIGTR